MKTLTRIATIGLFVLSAGSAAAAPVGYSVNADQAGGDELYAIDLANGTTSARGPVRSATTEFTDVEGLALAPDGTLWAVDEANLSLFPVNTGNGTVDRNLVHPVRGLDALSGNDFGMTFTCSGDLYVSTVADGALYRLELDGSATEIGALGANISALAAYGNPTRLFGLSNGLQGENGTPDTRSLYEIDPATGAATAVGPLGAAAADYYQAGLAFDTDGVLWAITDRRSEAAELPSEILRLDTTTGAATRVAETAQSGFESLAIASPSGCDGSEPPINAPAEFATPLPHIPTLDAWGRAGATLALLLVGLAAVRRRF